MKLEGIAQDNILLSSISVNIAGTAYNNIATYSAGSWTCSSDTGWSAEIAQATYADLIKAGIITCI